MEVPAKRRWWRRHSSRSGHCSSKNTDPTALHCLQALLAHTPFHLLFYLGCTRRPQTEKQRAPLPGKAKNHGYKPRSGCCPAPNVSHSISPCEWRPGPRKTARWSMWNGMLAHVNSMLAHVNRVLAHMEQHDGPCEQ